MNMETSKNIDSDMVAIGPSTVTSSCTHSLKPNLLLDPLLLLLQRSTRLAESRANRLQSTHAWFDSIRSGECIQLTSLSIAADMANLTDDDDGYANPLPLTYCRGTLSCSRDAPPVQACVLVHAKRLAKVKWMATNIEGKPTNIRVGTDPRTV